MAKVVTVLAVLLALGAGCRCVDRDVYGTLDEGWRKIRPYAERGIAADQDLSDADRALMIRVLDDYGLLLRDAGAQAGYVQIGGAP